MAQPVAHLVSFSAALREQLPEPLQEPQVRLALECNRALVVAVAHLMQRPQATVVLAASQVAAVAVAAHRLEPQEPVA